MCITETKYRNIINLKNTVMKKILLATVAALAITSCSQNEEFENAGQKAEIGFNTVVNNSTRAVEVDLPGLKKQGFCVYAYNTGGATIENNAVLDKPIMKNEKVTWKDNKWGSATYYWPSTGNVQFFAYSSKNALTLTTNEADAYPTLVDYEVANAAANQEDLLVAMATNKTKENSTVDFVFSHVLTQINFSIKSKIDDGLTYTLSKIEIVGANNKGTYNYKDNKWTNLTGTAKYEYTSTNESFVGTEAKPVNNEPLMLLPQDTSARKILISYTVTDTNNNEVYTTATPKEVDLTSVKWEVSKRIRYTLALTNDATVIGWEVSAMNGWEDETGTGDKEPADPAPVE